jgi:hypothetical protein
VNAPKLLNIYRSEEHQQHDYDMPQTYYVYISAHTAADAITCLKNSDFEVRSLVCCLSKEELRVSIDIDFDRAPTRRFLR